MTSTGSNPQVLAVVIGQVEFWVRDLRTLIYLTLQVCALGRGRISHSFHLEAWIQEIFLATSRCLVRQAEPAERK